MYHNFMTEAECDYFIQKAIDQGLSRSQVAAGKEGGSSSPPAGIAAICIGGNGECQPMRAPL